MKQPKATYWMTTVTENGQSYNLRCWTKDELELRIEELGEVTHTAPRKITVKTAGGYWLMTEMLGSRPA